MEKPQFLDLIDEHIAQSTLDNSFFETFQKQFDGYEREKNALLSLSNDITKVRDKNDLIMLLSSRIKSLFYFTYTIVSLIDQKREYYSPFLFDHRALAIGNHPEYPRLMLSRFDPNEPFIQKIIQADGPVTYMLEEIINDPGIPRFLTANYECGIREVMFTPLKNKDVTIGFVNIYSDKPGSFTSEFKNIMKGIAPHLSNAVANIVTNEEIDYNDRVNKVLLALSNEMVTVRNRMDLVNVINSGLKNIIYFTHNVITVIDETGEHYKAFLIDPESKSNYFSKYAEAISTRYPVNDDIYNVAALSDKPVVFDIKSLDLSKAPLWLKLNYAAGAREMVIKVLPDDGNAKHSIILFSDKPGTFDDRSLLIIERISSQLSTAANNIAANEEIVKKEKDKSFLLEFSNSLASVRTKDDLEIAIVNVLQNVLNIKLAMIRMLDEDSVGLSPYMYDKSLFYGAEDSFRELSSKKITIHEPLSARVLTSPEPVIFNIENEERNGNKGAYIQLWKKAGMKNAYGAALRVGNVNVGTLWLLTDDLNMTILKGICAQISIAISNIRANDQVLIYKQMLEVENDHLKEQIKTIYNFSDIIGNGPEMQKVYHLLSLVSETNSTVLLSGETGTGKELIARAIHNSSPRKSRMMVKVNCAALPANLIESELFGHEKGAFTGAIDRRIGKFELAHNSTIFLDEIGELPIELQVKLLHVIQEREFERIGGKTTLKVDVRIIAATNRDLEAEVQAGRFRQDLYYRLNVFPINLPSLRKRVEDIPVLANFFLARYSKNSGKKVTAISNNVMQELKSYLWPGNVRELEHLIERSILLADESVIREVHLPKGQKDSKLEREGFFNGKLEDVERAHIIQMLKRCGGKISGSGGAADLLDIPSTTLHSKLRKLAISKSDYFPKLKC